MNKVTLLIAIVGILVGTYFSLQERPVYQSSNVYNVQHSASLKVTEGKSSNVRMQPAQITQTTMVGNLLQPANQVVY
jgi:hypothetical protein